jgi:hypothetical protein
MLTQSASVPAQPADIGAEGARIILHPLASGTVAKRARPQGSRPRRGVAWGTSSRRRLSCLGISSAVRKVTPVMLRRSARRSHGLKAAREGIGGGGTGGRYGEKFALDIVAIAFARRQGGRPLGRAFRW